VVSFFGLVEKRKLVVVTEKVTTPTAPGNHKFLDKDTRR